MMKLLIVLYSLFLALAASADNIERRRASILRVINEEIKEVSKLSRQYRHGNPELLLRIAELYLEKARLIKDREQKKYLNINPKKRARLSKKRYFSESRKYFSRAQKMGRRIVGRFKRFKLKADVYYILAYNAKEFNNKKDAKKYFSLVLRNANRNSKIYKKAALALGELHYNDKNYGRALTLYQSGMKGRKNKWWTKDAFNMAWSLYRRKQYSKAIDLMNEIYELSLDAKYIDMRSQVERDIGLFYLSANRLDEGVDFYRQIDKDISTQLYEMGKILIDQKKPVEAEKVLREAKKKLPQDKAIDVNLILLSLFLEYGKYHDHLKVSKELNVIEKEGDLSSEQREVLIFQLKKMGGVLQKQVLSKGAKANKKRQRSKAKAAAGYFNILAKMESKERGKYLYLRAETYYATGLMEEALKSYQESFEYEKKRGNNKQARRSIEGVLAALASPALPKKTKEQYYLSSYNAYLKMDRKSKRADTIYQRVFQHYFDKKDLKNAENVLISYKASFPKNYSTQEAMVAKIMDYYRKTGNRDAFSEWVRKIKNKEYYVSRKYGEQLSKLLLAMRFENVEKAAKSGQKKNALEGYLAIYHDPQSAQESRVNAVHNITVLYFELGYADQTYLWAERAVKMMSSKKLSQFVKTYLTISSELFNMQRFNKSAQLSEKIYRKLCKDSVKQKVDLYKNSYIVYLSSEKFNESNRLINTGRRCGVSPKVVDQARFEVLNVLGEQKKWKEFESYLYKIKDSPSIRGGIIAQMALLRDAYREFLEKGRVRQLEREMESIYLKARKARQHISVKSLWVIAELRLRIMEGLVTQFNKTKLEFPQKKFDSLLEKKIIMLDKIATEAEKVFRTKSGRGSIKAYQFIIESYQRLVKEIREFKVVGKDAAYVKSFKAAMKQIERTLLRKSLSYLGQARKLIAGGKVLSPDSYWFIARSRIPFDVEYHFSGSGVLMDRRGRR